MGNVYADITIKNARDTGNAREGLIREEQIRSVLVKAMVDTGTMTLVISEELRRQLGLGILGFRNITLANYQTETVRVTEPVEIHWEDRYFIGSARVLSDRGAPLLGLLPLEYMDLMVDPVHQVLVGIHGDMELGMAVGTP